MSMDNLKLGIIGTKIEVNFISNDNSQSTPLLSLYNSYINLAKSIDGFMDVPTQGVRGEVVLVFPGG